MLIAEPLPLEGSGSLFEGNSVKKQSRGGNEKPLSPEEESGRK